MADYYQTLGVTKSATADEIKSAYRKLARKYHPDVNKEPGAQKKFTEVQQAYDVLSDDQKRKLYDQFGSAAFESGGPGTAAGQQRPGARAGSNPHYSWSNVGGPGGGPGFGVDFDVDDASSIFESIFGRSGMGSGPRPGGRPRSRTRATSPDDFGESEPSEVRQEITVDFMTAAKGGVQKLRVTEDGKPRTIEVTIPSGTEENSQLRVRNAVGGRDLILRIRIAAHELFRRGEGESTGKGLDLSLDLPLTIAEATLGAAVSVPTLTSPVEINIPAGTPSGRKIRLRGKGIHDPQGRQGDLYAVIKIVPPKGDALPEPQQEELRRIAAHTPPVRTGPYWPAKA